MKNANQWAGGIVLGAALAYVLDPDRGNRRRALIRDQMIRASRTLRDAAGVIAEDSRNRLYGTVTARRSSMRSKPVDDEVLVARVRSKLGRALTHPHAIDVTASNGEVTLHGPICADEVSSALRSVRRVAGVICVNSALEAHEHSEHIPSLQGSGHKTSTMRRWWNPTTAAAAAVLGIMTLLGAAASSRASAP
jgi:BON domain-containing protein